MKKKVKGPPVPAAVATPYGLRPLVEASAKLVGEHVLSDVTELVGQLAQAQGGVWGKFLTHTGWRDPGEQLGELDFTFSFPDPEGLAGVKISLLVYRIEGGNGEPLAASDTDRSVYIRYGLDDWGLLRKEHSHASTPEWAEWMDEADTVVRARWRAAVEAGQLRGLTSLVSRESSLAKMLRELWCREALKKITANLGLDPELVVIDDEQDAEHHCSSLEFSAAKVHLVTPWLAEALKKRGAVADIVLGLPLWSRDNADAPHLERLLQDITYEKFGQSMNTELAHHQE